MARISSAILCLSLFGCGGLVVVDPGALGSGGASTVSGTGGAGSDVSSSTTTSSSTSSTTGAGGETPTPPPGCENAACVGDTNSCSCSATCGVHPLHIDCAPNDHDRMQCVCVFEDVFAGACFEDGPAECDFNKSCCSKYFKGT